MSQGVAGEEAKKARAKPGLTSDGFAGLAARRPAGRARRESAPKPQASAQAAYAL
jgi:hypothetical protein